LQGYCVKDPADPSGPCVPCKKASLSASQCGPKTFARKGGRENAAPHRRGQPLAKNITAAPNPIIETVHADSTDFLALPQLSVTYLFEAELGVVSSLHELLLQRNLPELGVDQSETLRQISVRVSSASIALEINEKFQNLRSTDAQLEGFRVSVVNPFDSDELSWPLLEWKDQTGTYGLAIFDIDEESDGCSYLVHYASPAMTSCGEGAKRLPALAWNVTDLSTLKTLFQATQHALGILRMPKADALRLYCHKTEQNILPEEYSLILRHANQKQSKAVANPF
jgi:hypothetical protein